MTITVIGGDAQGSASGADVTVTHPGGIQTNDVVYIVHGVASDADETLTITTSGHTALLSPDLYGNGSNNDVSMQVWRKVQGGTPDSTATVDGTGSASDSTSACSHVYRGVDTTTPEDATTQTDTRTTVISNYQNPAIDTNTDGAYVLVSFCIGDNQASLSGPSGYGDVQTTDQNSSNDITGYLSSKNVPTAGTETPGTITNLSADGFGGTTAATIAVKPSSGGAVQQFLFKPPRLDGIGRGGIFPGNRVQ